jgi:hypothetical protein
MSVSISSFLMIHTRPSTTTVFGFYSCVFGRGFIIPGSETAACKVLVGGGDIACHAEAATTAGEASTQNLFLLAVKLRLPADGKLLRTVLSTCPAAQPDTGVGDQGSGIFKYLSQAFVIASFQMVLVEGTIYVPTRGLFFAFRMFAAMRRSSMRRWCNCDKSRSIFVHFSDSTLGRRAGVRTATMGKFVISTS